MKDANFADVVIKAAETRAAASTSPNSVAIQVSGRTYSTPASLAELLGVTTRTLSRWGEQRIGPPKIKIGKLVLYDNAKLNAWLESHERSSVESSKRRRGQV